MGVAVGYYEVPAALHEKGLHVVASVCLGRAVSAAGRYALSLTLAQNVDISRDIGELLPVTALHHTSKQTDPG